MKLLIRNLARATTESALRALFEPHGTVLSCTLVLDKTTGLSKGFGFVTMSKPLEAKNAMQAINFRSVEGNRLRVKKANTRPDLKKPNRDANVWAKPKLAMLPTSEIVPFIMDLFARQGTEEYMGEPVSMAGHMEQTAACALADNASKPLIAAALLHDIGHFVGDFPIDSLQKSIDNLHENIAAQFLAPYFPPSITQPIRLHVPAKKYLCAVDKNYYRQLSSASVQSLEVQGGPMAQQAIAAFEANPYYKEAVQLRKYDDKAKVAGKTIHPVSYYHSLLVSQLL